MTRERYYPLLELQNELQSDLNELGRILGHDCDLVSFYHDEVQVEQQVHLPHYGRYFQLLISPS
jgi:hypothetical protein